MLDQTGGLEDYVSVVDRLYGYRDRLDPWAQAMLALILYHQNPGDGRVETLLSDLESRAVRSASGVHWESSPSDWANPASSLFSTAVVFIALSEHDYWLPH